MTGGHNILIDARTRCELSGAIEVVRRYIETGGVQSDLEMPRVLGLLQRILDTPPPPPPDWEINSEQPAPAPPKPATYLETSPLLAAAGTLLLGVLVVATFPALFVLYLFHAAGMLCLSWRDWL